ncbi:unnamed protein product, partial [Didymodactylos carnosus]
MSITPTMSAIKYLFVLIVFCSTSNTIAMQLSDFFPYGPSAGDITMHPNDDQSDGPFNLPSIFPYFNNNHRHIYVGNNGLFAFLEQINQYTPDPFPLNDSRRLITGFWSDIDTLGRVSGVGNKVYYQIYDSTLQSPGRLITFEKATTFVRQYFPRERPFIPRMVITGTWYRVGAYSAKTDKLNTFQIVLVTDEQRSFTFLLYNDLQWAGPKYTTEPWAQAGFNGGDGVVFEMLPHSRTQDIVKLVSESNVNVPGLFVFRTDTETITEGGCGNGSSSSVYSLRPRIGSQLGLTSLNIQGPCYNMTTTLKCQFGSYGIVDGIIINEFRAVCLTPFAPQSGWISVSVSLDEGATYSPIPSYTYAPLKFGSDDVRIKYSNNQLVFTGQISVDDEVVIDWLFSEYILESFPNGTLIDVEFQGVKQSNDGKLEITSTIVIAQAITVESLDNGRYFYQFRIPSSVSTQSTHTGFIRVVARYNSVIYAGLNTGILAIKLQASLANDLCRSWESQQPEATTWNTDMLPCPMTRDQAMAARCCYELDQECFIGSTNPSNCWLHKGRPMYNEASATSCYLSKGTNRFSAGGECCYDSSNQLITRGTGAGSDDRYRPNSSPVGHFYSDIVPYIWCCLLSESSETCDTYYRLRPTRRGSNTMGENGGTWGDPHYTTLDGTSYTFNGYGEYTYLAIIDSSVTSPPAIFDPSLQYKFMSQIRTVALPNATLNATVTKSFVGLSNDIDAQP